MLERIHGTFGAYGSNGGSSFYTGIQPGRLSAKIFVLGYAKKPSMTRVFDGHVPVEIALDSCIYKYVCV